MRKISSKRKEAIYKQIIEYLNSEETRNNDIISQRIDELVRDKHLSLREAVKIAYKEFDIQ